MKIIKKLVVLLVTILGLLFVSQADAKNRFEAQSISLGSPLLGEGNYSTSFTNDNPEILGIIPYANHPGEFILEMASGYYCLLACRSGGAYFEQGRYHNPAPYSDFNPNAPGLMLTGLGRGYFSLFDDSYFDINYISYDLNEQGVRTGINGISILVYQHGQASPFFGEGIEVFKFDWNAPDDIAKIPIAALVCIPEPGSATLGLLGGTALFIIRRRK